MECHYCQRDLEPEEPSYWADFTKPHRAGGNEPGWERNAHGRVALCGRCKPDHFYADRGPCGYCGRPVHDDQQGRGQPLAHPWREVRRSTAPATEEVLAVLDRPLGGLVYCSPECKQKLWTRRNYQSRKARGLTPYVARERASNSLTCERCGCYFRSVRRDARFCSGECRQASWRLRSA